MMYGSLLSTATPLLTYLCETPHAGSKASTFPEMQVELGLSDGIEKEV